MRSLEEETLYYAIATLILFGTPVLAFFIFMKWQDREFQRNTLEKSDKEYKERYGELAYQQMVNERNKNKSNPFAKATNTPTSGVWHTRTRIDMLPNLIQGNHPQALIGNAPHRLDELRTMDRNRISLSGQWPYPKNAQITTIVTLDLVMSSHTDGGCAVRYKYTIAPADDPFAAQIVKITNFWLQNLLENPVA